MHCKFGLDSNHVILQLTQFKCAGASIVIIGTILQVTATNIGQLYLWFLKVIYEVVQLKSTQLNNHRYNLSLIGQLIVG